MKATFDIPDDLYHFSKADALAALTLVSRDAAVAVSAVARKVLALPNLATAKPGFVERLIHGSSHAAGHTLVTFETAAGRRPATRVLAS